MHSLDVRLCFHFVCFFHFFLNVLYFVGIWYWAIVGMWIVVGYIEREFLEYVFSNNGKNKKTSKKDDMNALE